MFDTITGLIPRDPDLPERAWQLDVLGRVLEGTLYDVLPHAFGDERGAGGEYIPLRRRRPSVRHNIARIVVEDSAALVFSEGHFPTLDCEDQVARDGMRDIVSESELNRVMLEALISGSVGSVAIQMRVVHNRVYFQKLDTRFLTPHWRADAPDELAEVVERYKVPGAALAARGYENIEPSAEYWFMRRWDAKREIWFLPWPVRGAGGPIEDTAQTHFHGLGCVPMVWIRNLPGGAWPDGGCTFRAAIETMIEIDYQLSQAGRGLKYSSDPTLLIKEPAGMEGTVVKGAGNALIVSEKGDAKLLEIGGTAAQAVIDYVRTLREFALEAVHGNRASPERLSAAQSGRAMELMNQGLLWLADNLRVSYGGGLVRLARMVARASNRFPLQARGRDIAPIAQETRWVLKWPRWAMPVAEDRERDARTLATLRASGQISRLTALKSIADIYDIEDVEAEMKRIAEEAPR